MQLPLEINARHVRLTDSVEELVRERTDHLERYYSRIISCHVSLEGPSSHHKHGGTFDVHIDLRVPGREIVVTHQKSGDLGAAIRSAFEAARRQLQDYAARQRGETKHHEEVPDEHLKEAQEGLGAD